MKRTKIKPKYLNQISINKKTTTNNIIDNIENKIKKILLAFGLIILLLFWSAIILIIPTILGIDYTKLSEIGKIIYLFLCDISFLILLFFIYHKTLKKDFHNYFNKNWKKNLKESLHYWAIGLIIMIISNLIISILTNGKLATNEEEVRNLINLAPGLMAFELAIYAPLSEELIFRKSIKDITNNPYLYPILSGFIFGFLHVISSLETVLDLLYLIPYCSLGFVFAKLYQKTDNIFSSITVHSIHNSLALVLYLITGVK